MAKIRKVIIILERYLMKLREILDETHFLENIDPSFLLDRKHYKLYPHTIFKFLNRDEIANVI